MINVKQTQKNLNDAGYPAGVEDGIWGRGTISALLAHQANRRTDTILLSLGQACVTELPKANIVFNKYRLAEWLAQTGHETGGYRQFEENMRYSAKRLVQVWPSRFKSIQQALPFAHDPNDSDREDVALANKVYGGRMGNEADGVNDNDGWDHRGGGLFQHTGAAEYAEINKLGITPEQVHGGDISAMVRAACDYWTRIEANEYCDRNTFTALRRRINGGHIGLEDIAKRRARSLLVIAQ